MAPAADSPSFVSTYRAPGIYQTHDSVALPPLSSADTRVAGMVGLSQRGPLNVPVRVSSWDEFVEVFGVDTQHYLTGSAYGYFRNGGQVLWVVRVAHVPAGNAARTEAHAAAAEHVQLDRWKKPTLRIRALDADALAQSLDNLDPRHCDCAIIVASEEPSVQAAVDAASKRGVVVMTLVSDLPGTQRRHFIGIDNVAAGRTAASLMGRFLPQGGKVAVIAGSLHLRDHSDRLAGFKAGLAAEFPSLELIGPVEGHDERSETQAIIGGLLAQHPDLAGLYNLGAGNGGLVSALESSSRSGAIRVIAHELTEPTRRGLKSGAIDIVLDQNPDGEIREAIAAARMLALGGNSATTTDPIEIGIFLRDNLR